MKGRSTRIFLDNCDSAIQAAFTEGIEIKDDNQYQALKVTLEMRLEKFLCERVKIHFFGSRIIGLADAKSDLDIFVEIGDRFYADKDSARDANALNRVADALSTCELWAIKVKLSNTSVPVLKTIYKPKNLECDFTVSNGLGVQNSLIMSHLLCLQPEDTCNPKFDGYLLKLLVIFYLQSENLLPSVVSVQRGLHEKLISGWNIQFDPQRTLEFYKKKTMQNFKHHIPNFFKFYATFDFWKHVMSVNRGVRTPREVYENQEEIKKEYTMCIFGPINKKHNIGKYIAKKPALKFFNVCDGLFFAFLKYHPWNIAYEKEEEQDDKH